MLCACVVVVSLCARPAMFDVIDCGVMAHHRSSHAYSLNNNSTVVGESTLGFLTPHACVWSEHVVRDVSGGTPSVTLSVADSGAMTGTYVTSSGDTHGWCYAQDACGAWTWSDVGTLAGSFCAPNAVNSYGVVVGHSHTSAYENHAFVWKGGVIRDVFPQYQMSDATSVNDRGDVCGYVRTESGNTVAFVMEHNAEARLLPSLGGEHSGALCVTARGDVVGFSSTSQGRRHACLWRGDVVVDMGVLSGDTTSSACSANDAGAVIGQSQSLGHPERQFLWTPTSGMVDIAERINTTSFQLERVSDINNHGEICGWGYFKGDDAPHAVLLRPRL